MTFSLKAKILMLAGFMTFTTVSVGGIGLWFNAATVSSFEKVVTDDVPGLRAMNRMLLAFRLARIELLHVVMPGGTEESNKESLETINTQWAALKKDEEFFESKDLSTEERQLFTEFKQATEIARLEFARAIAIHEKNPADDSPEYKEMARIVQVDLVEKGKVLKAKTDAIVKFQSTAIDEDSVHAAQSAATGKMAVAVTILLGALFSFGSAFVLATQISRKISAIITSISDSSTQVAAASSQIATTSQQLSQATTEQASSLEETAASLEEISTMIAKSAESSTTSEQSSAESKNKAEQGRKSVDQMMDSMNEISQSNEAIMNQINQSNEEMAQIVQVIQEIGNKTKVINEIVFQTKLLSFNASVEAARAGEHGKGFAVVAEEVGNLAQMSGNAAKEITEMLDTSIVKVETIVKNTKAQVGILVEQGKEKVDVGVDVARQCSVMLDEIVTGTTKVTSLAQEISSASKEQALGVREINKAMTQLDSVTQQNSSASEQSASAAEQLSAQAASLLAAVEEAVTVVSGSSGGQAHKLSQANTHKAPRAKAVSAADKAAKPSNVIPFKAAKKPQTRTQMTGLKAASGEQVPSHDDEGFQDI